MIMHFTQVKALDLCKDIHTLSIQTTFVLYAVLLASYAVDT